MKDIECKECNVSDDRLSIASTSNLSNVTTTSIGSLELFETIIIQPIGHSILQLSSKHKILIISIKWFGCPMCQKVIEELNEYLPSLLMLNIVPVICHQEDETRFAKHISHTKLFHCRISTQAKRMLLINKASMIKHMKAMPTILKLMLKERRKFFLPSLSEIKEMELVSTFGMHIVRNGQVETSYFYKNLLDRPDLGKFVFNLSNSDQSEQIETNEIESEMVFSHKKSEMESVEQFLPNLIKLYPDLKKIYKSTRQKRSALPTSSAPEVSPTLSIEPNPPISTPSALLQVPISIHNRRPSTSSIGSSSSSISSSFISMNSVLENATMRSYFKAHLSNMYSLELVLFLEQVNIYKFLSKSLTRNVSLTTEEQLLHDIRIPASEQLTSIPEYEIKANSIIETFLNDDAMFHINTSRKLIERMKNTMEEKGFVEDLFDEIGGDVKSTMLVYLFASFKETSLFMEMMQRFKK